MAAFDRGRRPYGHAASLLMVAVLTGCFFELPDARERPGPLDAGGGSGGRAGAGGTSEATVGTGSGGVSGWWNVEWTRRIRLGIDNSAGEAMTDFPLLVTLTRTRVDYTRTADDAADVRFVADDGQSVLPHEVERWDESGT